MYRPTHIVAKLLALFHIGTQTKHVIPGGVLLRDRIENRLLPGQLFLLLPRQFVDAVQNILLFAQLFVEDRREPFNALRVLGGGLGITGNLLGQLRQILRGGREFLLQVLDVLRQLFRCLHR